MAWARATFALTSATTAFLSSRLRPKVYPPKVEQEAFSPEVIGLTLSDIATFDPGAGADFPPARYLSLEYAICVGRRETADD
jgi:hypothetical protein